MAQKDCKLCNYFKNCFKSYQILNRALYNKYSQSQDYFYGKLIQKFTLSESNQNVVDFKDQIFYYDDEEYFKKVYYFPRLNKKIKDLFEYYKYHTEIPRVYMLPISLVCNFFHDKKRRLNYYKIKLKIHQQNGNQDKLEITESNSSDSECSSTPSQSQFAITQFLKPHLLKSFNFSKVNSKFKDSIVEINEILQNMSKLNLKDVEQYSYFLMDTQITDQSNKFKKNFQDKLQKIKSIYHKLQGIKQTQIETCQKKIKFVQKSDQKQTKGTQTKLADNIQKQMTRQKSIQSLLNEQLQKKQIQPINFNNFQNQFQQFHSTRNKNIQDNSEKKSVKKKQNNFRTQSEMNIENLFTPQQSIKNKFDFNQNHNENQNSLKKKQSYNKLIRPQSNDKKIDILTKQKQTKKQSLDLKNQKQLDIQNEIKDSTNQKQNMVFLTQNSVVKIKQTFNNFASPQYNNNKFEQNSEQNKRNLFRNRSKQPQSMQITNEFLIKVNKQYEGERLNAMIQQFKKAQNLKSQEKQKLLTINLNFKDV